MKITMSIWGKFKNYCQHSKKIILKALRFKIAKYITALLVYFLNLESKARFMKIVPNDFFQSAYRIKDDVLNFDIVKMIQYSEELAEKCGDIDFELNKIIVNSNKLFDYINENMNLKDDIEKQIILIRSMKEKKSIISKCILINSLKSIKFGIKKNNISKILSSVMKC